MQQASSISLHLQPDVRRPELRPVNHPINRSLPGLLSGSEADYRIDSIDNHSLGASGPGERV
jgi:hypothetical protein